MGLASRKGLSIFRKYLTGTFLFISSCSISQTIPKIDFIRIGLKEGLDQAPVSCIIQDSENYIWFETVYGLNKYDGYKITTYINNPDDPGTISNNHIGCIYEDRKKNLWVGTMDGLNLFNREQNNFTSFKHDPHNPKSIGGYGVESIYEDKEGNLWIGTNDKNENRGGLNLFDKKGGFIHYRHDPYDPSSIGGNVIKCFFEDEHGNLWIGLDNGMSYFDKKKKTFVTYRPESRNKNGLSGSVINDIIEDKNKNLWIATQDGGLNVFNKKTKTFKHYIHDEKDAHSLGSNTVYCLLLDNAGNIWVGGEHSGLNLYNPIEDNFIIYKHSIGDLYSLSSNSIGDLCQDRNGNIWIGHYKRGINVFSPKEINFKHYTEEPGESALSSNLIKGFWEDKQSNIWIATDGGLNKFNPLKKTFISYRHSKNSNSIKTDALLCVREDRFGMLWIGTWGGGLNLLDRKTNTFKHYLHDPNDSTTISGNEIFSILDDSKGNLWVGTFYDGFNLLDRKNGTFKRYPCHFRNENSRIFTMLEDKEGYLWIGTNSSGIGKFDPIKKAFVGGFELEENLSHGLVGNGISALYEDSKGRLWVGTEKGLNILNSATQKFSSIREIGIQPIQGINEDDNGNLWLSTLNIIIKFDPDKKTLDRFSDEDGLRGNHFVEHAYLKARNGEMYFGGTNGFNVFHPNNIKRNLFIPPVYFTDFQIFNTSIEPGEKSPLKKHISKTKEIILSYTQSVISFEFAALNYTNSNKNQYAYMLEGFDRDWNYIGSKRTVTYTNLDPGDYTLKVKASNNDGVWNEEGASLKLIITPPFWKTWWAYLFYVVLIIIALYIFRRYSIIQIKDKNRLVIEGLENKKAAELTEAKMQFFTNISHEIRTPLTLIDGPLERVIAEDELALTTKKDLDAVSRNVKRLLRLANQLLQFRKLDSGHIKPNVSETAIVPLLTEILKHFEQHSNFKNITIKLENQNSEDIRLWIDQEMITTVFYNLLANALKFTAPGGEVIVKIYECVLPKNGWENKIRSKLSSKYDIEGIAIEIRDTGKGIPPEEKQKIFQRFYQLKNSNNDTSGSGLGLALVKEYVELHQGYIDVKSKLNEGTAFTVYLPKGIKINGKKNEEIQDVHANLISFSNDNPEDSIEETELTTEGITSDENIQTEKPLILVVEDDAELSEYLYNYLLKSFRVEIAKDGKEGVDKALIIVPDLIISDIAMPEMNGYDLCKTLKSNIATSHIPVMLLTAKVSDENVVLGYNCGADAYVPKPFKIKVIESQVKSLIRSREILRDKYRKMLLMQPADIVADSADERFLKQLMEIVEENIPNSKFDVPTLAMEMGTSQTVLLKKVKSLTSLSIAELIKTTRLKKAAMILTKEKYMVSEVCYMVGFTDPHYFSKCFVKEFGKTPKEFKVLPAAIDIKG